jgi:hypothetical protein
MNIDGVVEMPKCPNCKKDIVFLINKRKATIWCFFDGAYYEQADYREDAQRNHYQCPECEMLLFITEQDAKRFMKVKGITIFKNTR